MRKPKTDHQQMLRGAYYKPKDQNVSVAFSRAKFMQAIAIQFDWLLPELESLNRTHRSALENLTAKVQAEESSPSKFLYQALEAKRTLGTEPEHNVGEILHEIDQILDRINFRVKWFEQEVIQYILLCVIHPAWCEPSGENQPIARQFWAKESFQPGMPFLHEVHRFVWNEAIDGYMQGHPEGCPEPPPYSGEVVKLGVDQLNGYAVGRGRLFEFRSIGIDPLLAVEPLPKLKKRITRQFEISLDAYIRGIKQGLLDIGYEPMGVRMLPKANEIAVKYYLKGKTIAELEREFIVSSRSIERQLRTLRSDIDHTFPPKKRGPRNSKA